ncbi:hypothetical protein BKH46_07770 [Helicobacter sp. 12S02634-8]|uniref:tRNA1(Val) (adenine(37)-N6)-methyltransferase n=1 Tax=Helicobacter sp. 12S02634-8 TaxID=1476199 RepID=UPI000BA4EC1C|nr:methyltransferase [Helicobacter sp. 12S02634-8]PAF46358.1 hypothetical protein BKH46_07770 [Helicobacter sp. 12S02634-8]
MDKKILKIYQLSDGYCYNSDSLFLYDFARRFFKKSWSVLEVGSGSGVVGLLCAREGIGQLVMVERDSGAAFLSKINAKSAGLEAQVVCADFLQYQTLQRFDMIISNPPFYRTGVVAAKNHRVHMGRNEMFLPFENLCKQVKRFLKPKGSFVFCYDAKEAHRVFYLLKATGFNAETARFVYPRIEKEASLILCQARINTQSSLKILPPLIVHYSPVQTDNTDEVREIYKRSNTYSIKVCSQHLPPLLGEDY